MYLWYDKQSEDLARLQKLNLIRHVYKTDYIL